jgi:hypothetical protein
MTSITIDLPEHLRVLVDEARGDKPIAEYALTALEEQALRDMGAAVLSVAEVTPGLTPADHVRLADLAEQPGQSMSPDEMIAKVKAHFPDLWPEGASK